MEKVKTQEEKKLAAVTRETKERASRLHTQLQCTAQALTEIKDGYTALQQATQAWPQLVESTLISTKHQVGAGGGGGIDRGGRSICICKLCIMGCL